MGIRNKDAGSPTLGKEPHAVTGVLPHLESSRLWALPFLESGPGVVWFAVWIAVLETVWHETLSLEDDRGCRDAASSHPISACRIRLWHVKLT